MIEPASYRVNSNFSLMFSAARRSTMPLTMVRTSSLVSVLCVNWIFTYPYWVLDLISPECISSAVVMLIVSTMTGALTTRLKQQEKLKAEAETERMRGNLLRAVSHDLRTPLTSIYGSCSAIIENFDSIPREKQLKLLKDIQSDSAQFPLRTDT